jgi:hypothetical protein
VKRPDPERAAVLDDEPPRARLRGELGWPVRGPLGETMGRISTCCSREQMGQFWIKRLCRQKVGIGSGLRLPCNCTHPGVRIRQLSERRRRETEDL